MSINAYWISPDGIHHPVTTTQIDFVADNPNLFGLTPVDSKKEKAILTELYDKGWMYIENDSQRNYWTTYYSGKIKFTKQRLHDWIRQHNILESKPHFLFISSTDDLSNVNYKEIERFLTEKNFEIRQQCLSCKYSVWAVGVGQGFFCKNKKKIDEGGDRVTEGDFKRFLIPFRNFICDNFESKYENCPL